MSYLASTNSNEGLVLNFKLEHFDGPLDLLIELIKEKKMDILTLDIADLTYQYLEFVNENLTKYPIDDISEYLVMAAYLTDLKTKMLIPLLTQGDAMSETELEIDRLRRQLFLYKQYKDVINEFKALQTERTKYISKTCDDLDEFIPDDIPEAPLPEHIPIDRIVRAWQKIVVNMKENEIDKTFVIKVNNIDMDKIQDDLVEFVKKNKDMNDIPLERFITLFDESNNDLEYQCAIFISLLVLAKDGYIKIRQERANDTIYISCNHEQIKDIEHEDIKLLLKSHEQLAKDLEKDLYTKEDIDVKLRELVENKKASSKIEEKKIHGEVADNSEEEGDKHER